MKPRLAITLGDPAGIGLEVVRKAVNSFAVKKVCRPVVFGDASFANYFKSIEFVSSSNIESSIKLGVPSKKAGIVAISAIYRAVEFCTNNKILSLVTAPVSKKSFKMAGVEYVGHTELLAALTKSREVAMMMRCGNIYSVMVTRHIPISKISENIKTKSIVKAVNLSINFLKKIGKSKIKAVLCSLNPHAGDSSILGFEEKKIILPAYRTLKASGVNITKPLSADSAWSKAKSGQYDLICAMYHDQIMIALKCIDATKIVNITIGLPFLRTSPGHGTAFDIVGRDKANANSMIEAVLCAASYITVA
jgi:4-hydroxythreonine-4-phosphate dehydrogenase